MVLINIINHFLRKNHMPTNIIVIKFKSIYIFCNKRDTTTLQYLYCEYIKDIMNIIIKATLKTLTYGI